MFRTDIRAMNSAADEMQWQIRKLNQQIGNLEDVERGLGGLSGMEGIRRKIRSEIAELEDRQRAFRQMMTALQVSSRCYGNCEQDCIEYAEESRNTSGHSMNWVSMNTVSFPDGIDIVLK